MTKNALRKENERLSRENEGLRRANRALGEEVNFLADKINRAVDLCYVKIRQKKGPPAWLKEVMADG